MIDQQLAERLAEVIVEIGHVRLAIDSDDFGGAPLEAMHGLLDRIEARLLDAWHGNRRCPSQLSRRAVARGLAAWDELHLIGEGGRAGRERP